LPASGRHYQAPEGVGIAGQRPALPGARWHADCRPAAGTIWRRTLHTPPD